MKIVKNNHELSHLNSGPHIQVSPCCKKIKFIICLETIGALIIDFWKMQAKCITKMYVLWWGILHQGQPHLLINSFNVSI